MSLFQCKNCGVVENSATSDGGYIARLLYETEVEFFKDLDRRGLCYNSISTKFDSVNVYCSHCWTGKWHGRFEPRFYRLDSLATDHHGNIRTRSMVKDPLESLRVDPVWND